MSSEKINGADALSKIHSKKYDGFKEKFSNFNEDQASIFNKLADTDNDGIVSKREMKKAAKLYEASAEPFGSNFEQKVENKNLKPLESIELSKVSFSGGEKKLEIIPTPVEEKKVRSQKGGNSSEKAVTPQKTGGMPALLKKPEANEAREQIKQVLDVKHLEKKAGIPPVAEQKHSGLPELIKKHEVNEAREKIKQVLDVKYLEKKAPVKPMPKTAPTFKAPGNNRADAQPVAEQKYNAMPVFLKKQEVDAAREQVKQVLDAKYLEKKAAKIPKPKTSQIFKVPENNRAEVQPAAVPAAKQKLGSMPEFLKRPEA